MKKQIVALLLSAVVLTPGIASAQDGNRRAERRAQAEQPRPQAAQRQAERREVRQQPTRQAQQPRQAQPTRQFQPARQAQPRQYQQSRRYQQQRQVQPQRQSQLRRTVDGDRYGIDRTRTYNRATDTRRLSDGRVYRSSNDARRVQNNRYDRGDYRRGGNNVRYQNGRIQNDRRYSSNGRYAQSRNWSRDWRQDRRYDWNRYRSYNRNAFRLPRYYAPYGWNSGYRRFGIGFRLSSVLFGQNYWINDPWDYRLPPAYDGYRWVRYYNDAILVDLETGSVVDVIHDIFY